MPQGNPPLPGPKVRSTALLYELSNADTFSFDMELGLTFFDTRQLPDSVPNSTTDAGTAPAFNR